MKGRRIYDNIRKFIRYLLSANLSEVLVVLIATLVNLPSPLKPIQLLWINLVTDGLPAIALGVEPAAIGIMSKKPRNPNEDILSKKMISSITAIGIAGTIVTLLAFILELGHASVAKAQTIAFTTLVVFEMFVAFACRSETHPIYKIGFFSNQWLLLSVILSLILQLSVLYVPYLQQMFSVEPLTNDEWVFIILISSIVFIGEELYKMRSVDSGKIK